MLERRLAVNLFGTYAVAQAFPPLPARSVGCVVNSLSVTALAPCRSSRRSRFKAAAFSLTQALRIMLASSGIRVRAVPTAPVATDMTTGLDIPKISPESVAQGIFDAVRNDEDEIFPDAPSRPLAAAWRSGVAKVLENHYAALLDAAGATHQP